MIGSGRGLPDHAGDDALSMYDRCLPNPAVAISPCCIGCASTEPHLARARTDLRKIARLVAPRTAHPFEFILAILTARSDED